MSLSKARPFIAANACVVSAMDRLKKAQSMALTTQALAAINGLALDRLMRAQSIALTK